jgi:hypothetical protein
LVVNKFNFKQKQIKYDLFIDTNKRLLSASQMPQLSRLLNARALFHITQPLNP